MSSVAVAGSAWADATKLTVSFAPDGTRVGGQTSSLFATMGNIAGTDVLKTTILDALQTWAANANVNIGLVADGGQPFGTSGKSQGDPRFGDIRIGAAPLSSNVLAIAISPTGSLSGTWAGDIVFNSNVHFSSLSELYAVSLHEAGHSLGLPDSTDPNSPLFTGFQLGTTKAPTSADLAALQRIYGPRVAHPANNGSLANALDISYSTGDDNNSTAIPYNGSTPLVNYGQIGLRSEANYFTLTSPSGYTGSITFELYTAGISGLSGNISVYDAQGNLLAQSTANGGPGQDASVQVGAIANSSSLFIKVESGTNGIYGVGSYAVVTKFDGTNIVSQTAIDAVARGNYATLSASQVRQFFLTGTLPRTESDSQTPPSLAGSRPSTIELAPTPTFAGGTQYNAAGVLTGTLPDVTYRVESPLFASGQPIMLTVAIQSDQSGGILPSVTVLDENRNVLTGQLLSNGSGLYTLQVNGVVSGNEYFVRIESSATPANNATAGYGLSVNFNHAASPPNPSVSGTLGAAQTQQLFQFNVGQSALFQFGLDTSSSNSSSNVAVQLAIFDQSGNQVYQIVGTTGGILAANAVLLQPGNYFVRVSAASSTGSLSENLGFAVPGRVFSDPIGPIPVDPTAVPPTGSTPLPPPFNWNNVVILPPPNVIPPSFYWWHIVSNPVARGLP